MQRTGPQDRLGSRRRSAVGGRGGLARLLLLALLLGTGLDTACLRSTLQADLDRNSRGDEDLVALLPGGLDAVLDVDVAGLRQLDSAQVLLGYLPKDWQAHLETLIDQPLRNLDALAVGLRSMGTKEYDVIVVVRGPLGRERVERGVRALRPGAEIRQVEYHGVPLIETIDDQEPGGAVPSGIAAALVSTRTVVLASRFAVRQSIDIYRGADDGARQQGDLMAALRKAPRAKVGRPAVLLATLMTPPVRERLRTSGLPELGADAEYIAAALAVGDGIDLGVVAAYADLTVAKDVASRLLDRVQALRQRPALSFLGIERYIEALAAVAVAPSPAKGRRSPELHLAYRLSNVELKTLLNRITKLQQLRDQLGGN